MELNFKVFGEGPALIILHGLFGALDNWQTLAKRFAEDFTVYTVDQRNHGRSPHSDEPFTYESLALDLEEFMDQEGITSASLIGHSMGGKTVMQFASESPERVEKMLVADMGPFRNEPVHFEILDTLNAFPLEEITSRKEANAWMEARISDFGIRQFLLKNLDRSREKGFRWKFNLKVLTRDYILILDEVTSYGPVDVPALFIRGGKSGYIKDSDLPGIQELFPQAEIQTIANAGHWIHAEAPDEFYQRASDFLKV